MDEQPAELQDVVSAIVHEYKVGLAQGLVAGAAVAVIGYIAGQALGRAYMHYKDQKTQKGVTTIPE